MDWKAGLLSGPAHAALLDGLAPRHIPAGTAVFHARDHAASFVIVLEGRIEVRLTTASGREMLLYAVESGQSCVQTTLGLLGDEPYTGDAVAAADTRAVLIPKAAFLTLMDQDKGFRNFVLRAFGRRMHDLTRVLEEVAFAPLSARLAHTLLDMAEDGTVHATQADLAARLGTAREVVARHLHGFAQKGLTQTVRGQTLILDEAGLRRLFADLM